MGVVTVPTFGHTLAGMFTPPGHVWTFDLPRQTWELWRRARPIPRLVDLMLDDAVDELVERLDAASPSHKVGWITAEAVRSGADTALARVVRGAATGEDWPPDGAPRWPV